MIKELLKKNEKSHIIGMVMKNINDERFRKKFFAVYKDPNALIFEHLGRQNEDKNIYWIYSNSSVRGFFSLFNLVLDGLQFADYYHLIPVVEYGNKTLYNEEQGINGIFNSYEYYFEQPSSISVESAKHSRNVVRYEQLHRKLSIPDFSITIGSSLRNEDDIQNYIINKGKIIKKYIRYNDDTKSYLNRTVNTLFGSKRTLGVHVRGTDMKIGYNGHAKAVNPQEYLNATIAELNKHNYDQVFLATDEEYVIDLFKKSLGSRLVYFSDILRSNNGKALHFSQNTRKNHKYKLGLEVLRDMYGLSISDGIVSGISNVSLTARMMKISNDKNYDSIRIISHGFNNTNLSMVK